MRLWSLHPRHLDPQGLVALWREGLLARAVLHEQTRGYRNHPQLDRFKAHPQPKRAINAYLSVVQEEATARGYNFDRSKLGSIHAVEAIAVERGQLEHERAHLLAKLAVRNPSLHAQWCDAVFDVHPLFETVEGGIATWERA
ncbi:pyrimidine dimer DNA glycosylase/endonuclease V [Thermomonas sp. HDW16]|uniref:pyrimidine dimer DNA glycosylase/endonuclease V n=1 Tax=Thermomonas sp. HDW16 TaxID=2714945 RepID=UPI001407F65A|nr:pyrimidine dimer DNA glycosylase/endonuclease V [Thermomonas sp. HDW16]QIL19503.1 DNA lyase [Thermomonas sp. HDW16]